MAKKLKNLSLKEQAEKILENAVSSNVEKNYLFVTTFKRYMRQIETLEELEKNIEETDTLVTKEYVKGRQNVYVNPSISEYNKTTDSANKTLSALMKIMKHFESEETAQEDDVLMSILNGDDVDD